MSGSNSSGHGAQSADRYGLVVHSLPEARVPDAARQRSGRIKMLLLLLACAAPVLASYVAYYALRPQGRVNYSELIEPTRSLPDLPLRTLDGAPVAADSLHGQWLLIATGPAACAADCQQRLYLQRQLREMLGRERDRIDKVWLVTDDAALPPALRSALQLDPAPRILRVSRQALTAWLQPANGHALEDHLYVVDPMGEWMMRLPAEPDPAKAKRDLERLLRASAGWDRPGR